jgi:uncharacterized membrane protein
MSHAAPACPVCGEKVRGGHQFLADSSLNSSRKIAAAASYITFIPAAFFLFSGRFKTDSFVRFHSFQSIIVTIALTLQAVVLGLIFKALSIISFLIATLLVFIFCLAALILWMLLVVKALQGQRFKLPWIGEMAEKQALA